MIKSLFSSCSSFNPGHPDSDNRVFGSVVRGEATPNSDIDFLVELKPQSSLFDYIGLMQDLAALLGRKVDIAEPDNLHELIRDKILNEAVPL